MMKWVSINDYHIPLRRFFKQSMKKIREHKNEIMNYVNTNIFYTKQYFNKYTMMIGIVSHKKTKKSTIKNLKKNSSRKSRDK